MASTSICKLISHRATVSLPLSVRVAVATSAYQLGGNLQLIGIYNGKQSIISGTFKIEDSHFDVQGIMNPVLRNV